METVAVNCNSCGAPLEVGPNTNFVTCAHCGARLAVRRTPTSAYTDVLERIDRKTEVIVDQLTTIARQGEIERIDREWEQERAKYLGKDGAEPTSSGGLVGGVVMALFGVFWLVGASSANAPAPFVLFGWLFIGVALVGGFQSMNKGNAYLEAKSRYERRRAAALAEHRHPDANPPPG